MRFDSFVNFGVEELKEEEDEDLKERLRSESSCFNNVEQ